MKTRGPMSPKVLPPTEPMTLLYTEFPKSKKTFLLDSSPNYPMCDIREVLSTRSTAQLPCIQLLLSLSSAPQPNTFIFSLNCLASSQCRGTAP